MVILVIGIFLSMKDDGTIPEEYEEEIIAEKEGSRERRPDLTKWHSGEG